MELIKKGDKFYYKNRLSIGMVVDRINEVGGYQSTLWKGISETAAERNCNLVCFTGGHLRQSADDNHKLIPNQIYDLISNQFIDGLIVCTMAMGSGITDKNIASFCQHYSDLAIVSIGMAIEGIPSLVIDNKAGIHKAVDHLVKVHGIRRIAFIRGPLGNYDAEQRLKGFIDEIDRFNIPFDPQMIIPGDFLRSSGEKAVETLFNIKNTQFEAIISSSDDMAIGVMNALSKRNLYVPDDMALIGFDDIEDAKTTLPPLTTVKQPLYDIGKQAVEKIIAQIHGESVEEQTIIPTELVIRQTCGCGFEIKRPIIHLGDVINEKAEDIDQKYLSQLIEIVDDAKFGPNDLSPNVILLFNSFKETLKDPKRINNLLNDVLRIARGVYLKTELEPYWYRIMAILSSYAIELADSQERLLSHAHVCHAVWEVFGKISWLSTSLYKLKSERKTEPLRRISDSLLSTFDIGILMNTITSILSGLEVKQCWISVFEGQKKSFEKVKLILGYDEIRQIKIMSEDFVYPAGQFVPTQYRNLEERSQLIVIPLKFKGEIFGYSIFSMDNQDLSIYELLSLQISTAYQGAKVVEELKQTQEELREQANIDPLTQVYNRRYFFEFARTAYKSAFRYKRQLSLLLIDMDNFKIINDRFGHTKGDSILKKFAQILKSTVRAPDIFARYGGDEFISIMPETGIEEAEICAERLRKLVEDRDFGIHDDQCKLTVSIGIAVLDHETDQSLESLIGKADEALYQAKLRRNSVLCWMP